MARPTTATGGRAQGWVDDVFLAGPDGVCLRLAAPLTRAQLRARVAEAQARLASARVAAGSTVALLLPPSVGYVAMLLGAWRAGAQVVLLDHRLTGVEVAQALSATAAQFVVDEPRPPTTLAGYAEVFPRVTRRPSGRPAGTTHALVQLSSGSTGPSKVVGRHASAIVEEVQRFARLPGMPRRSDRLVLLNSLVHSFGLVGGLLHGLHAGVEIVLPRRHTARDIVGAITADDRPVTLFGVPFHAELLAAAAHGGHVQLARAVSGGELTRPEVAAAFAERYGVALGEAYGMTEVGVIAADLEGRHRPAVGVCAPGVQVRECDGQLWVRCCESPYLGEVEQDRYVGGWLATRDAGSVDGATGLVTVRGRLDGQVSIGGTKVHLSEVEHAIAGLPQVAEAVVVHDAGIRAYVVLRPGASAPETIAAARRRLAPFKVPRHWEVLPRLPRTASGKLVRVAAALREVAGA